ncbi:MAG: hypothetical protein SFV51_14745 [Bryobacteraceae bacterium]|nr:hypothetical protein [Bryobacteraceae bacterium]
MKSAVLFGVLVSAWVPSSREVGHEMLHFYTANTPPDFSAPPSDAFIKAAGLTREEWTAKSRAVSDIVKQEIWRSVFSTNPTELILDVNGFFAP